MALGRELLTSIGIPATFWLVAKVDTDKIAEQAVIILYGYANKAHCDMNKGYLERRIYNIYPQEFRQYFTYEALNDKSIWQIGYEIVKAKDPDFEYAMDLIYDNEGHLITPGE